VSDFGIFVLPSVLIFCGLFSIVCALKDYDWFMNSRRAAFFLRVFGRKGARAFYVLLGAALIIFSAYAVLINPELLR
jgi:hypothetical protein